MDIQTFRASNMQEALAMIRQELGPTAAILHTREIRRRPWLGLLPARREIEVTASCHVNVPSRFPDASPRAQWPHDGNTVQSRIATQRGAPTRHDVDGELTSRIGRLQNMVEDLCQRTRGSFHDLGEDYFRLYTALIDADLREDVARDLVDRVKRASGDEPLADVALARMRVARMLEEEIAVTGPILVTSDRRRVVALVGPTGVGKTTTIAKLAAHYRLREKCRVGLVTVDTYRIAAVEQLRTYADIIDLPMEVVATPREMHEALRRLAEVELVLVDTAGRSPRDEVKVRELRAFLEEAQPDEVHLVLSSVSGSSSLVRTAERFRAVGTTALVLTKLDEALALGHLLPLLRASKLPLSYLTDGQNVPDDIEPAVPGRLARTILGIEADGPD